MANFDEIIGSISSTAGAVTGIGSAVGALTSLFGGGDDVKKSYKYQKKLAAYQSQLQYDNWLKEFDATNAYNTPLAQRERLTTAGYNPNLLYGLGSAGNSSMGAAASAPSGQLSESFGSTRAKKIQALSAMQQASTAQQEAASRIAYNKAAADNQEAQAEQIRNKDKREEDLHPLIIANYKAMTAMYQAEKELKEIDKRTREQFNQKQIEEIDKRMALMAEQITDMQKQRELREREFEFQRKIAEENIKISWANIAVQRTNAQANLLQAKSQARLNEAMIPVQKELANYYNRLAANVDIQIAINKEVFKDLQKKNLLNYDSKYGYQLKLKGVTYKDAKKFFTVTNRNLLGYLQPGSRGGAFLCLNNAQMAMLSDRQLQKLNVLLSQYNTDVAKKAVDFYEYDKAMEYVSGLTSAIGNILGGSGVYQSSTRPQLQNTTTYREKGVTTTNYHY